MSINAKEAIKVVLEQHRLWIVSDGYQGTRADFQGADLEGANLYGANLQNADLEDANLENAHLRFACMGGTIFEKKEQEKVSEESSSSSNLRAELEAVANRLSLIHI